jgi:signal transduction histidine kinase
MSLRMPPERAGDGAASHRVAITKQVPAELPDLRRVQLRGRRHDDLHVRPAKVFIRDQDILSARSDVDRKDEIGTVARSFDSMAERIQTLLAAERRLLQDVSHELRSPLARLSFATALMKDAKDPDAAIERVKREVDHPTVSPADLNTC